MQTGHKPDKVIEDKGVFRLEWENRGFAFLVLEKIEGTWSILAMETNPKKNGLGRLALTTLRERGYIPLMPIHILAEAYPFWQKMLSENLIDKLE